MLSRSVARLGGHGMGYSGTEVWGKKPFSLSQYIESVYYQTHRCEKIEQRWITQMWSNWWGPKNGYYEASQMNQYHILRRMPPELMQNKAYRMTTTVTVAWVRYCLFVIYIFGLVVAVWWIWGRSLFPMERLASWPAAMSIAWKHYIAGEDTVGLFFKLAERESQLLISDE